VTPGLWLLLGAFFAVMGGLLYGYWRITRWSHRMRDEAIRSLPHIVITYRSPDA
jgi:hypothetical protein